MSTILGSIASNATVNSNLATSVLVAPSANTAGITLKTLVNISATLIYVGKVAPTSITDVTQTLIMVGGILAEPLVLPAGYGVYAINSQTVGISRTYLTYDLGSV